jgi:hypothetical protein
MQRSPNKSTRKAAAQLEISRQLMQRILKHDLNKYPYKMTMLPKLTAQNKDKKMAFAEWAQNNEVSFNVWFSDEVNKQTVQFWASENPRVIHGKVHHAPRITVWVTISSHGLLWSIFFEETVNSEHYLSLLCNTLCLTFLLQVCHYKRKWFVLDGARPHIANVVLYFLYDTFDSCHLKLIS